MLASWTTCTGVGKQMFITTKIKEIFQRSLLSSLYWRSASETFCLVVVYFNVNFEVAAMASASAALTKPASMYASRCPSPSCIHQRRAMFVNLYLL